MNNKIVIDTLFGDCGKGLVTSFLSSQTSPDSTIVVRFSGGSQAGHTVVYDNHRHVFSNLCSGTLQGIPSYWSEYCTFNPISFMILLYSFMFDCLA